MSLSEPAQATQAPSTTRHRHLSVVDDLPPDISNLVGSFLKQVHEPYDTVAVKRDYVEMCGGDWATAAMLAQVIYWCAPDRKGHSKLRVQRVDGWWIAKSAKDWN
jgi:hypothetical protein